MYKNPTGFIGKTTIFIPYQLVNLPSTIFDRINFTDLSIQVSNMEFLDQDAEANRNSTGGDEQKTNHGAIYWQESQRHWKKDLTKNPNWH